ncbi:hypothetical protein ACFQL1_15940 [Halomicroarcula sp. GCM10025709]|uniref:hypothetical protein n=1 Tax=Halomicroarcula sp. GCM10025709 TaxID=3252669 RepID=UPI003612A456
MVRDPAEDAARIVSSVKRRVQRLEEARFAAPPSGSFSSGNTILSPVTRIPDRAEASDSITVTEKTSPASQYIEDWEDNDIAEYSGDTGSAAVVANPVYQQTYAGELTSGPNGGQQAIYSADGDGLPYYPVAGDQWGTELWVNNSNAINYVLFGGTDLSNHYEVRITDSALQAREVSGGTKTLLIDQSAGIPTGQWLRLVVSWLSGGGFDLELYRQDGTSVVSGSTTNDTFSEGGIGWGLGRSGSATRSGPSLTSLGRSVARERRDRTAEAAAPARSLTTTRTARSASTTATRARHPWFRISAATPSSTATTRCS